MSDDVPAPPAPRVRLKIVAAMATNRVIGRAGQLPWHLPDDLKHFKELTLGGAVIMGRRTWDSIGKPLPGRRNIIVSTTLAAPPHSEVSVARSLGEAAALAGAHSAWVIGGAALYAAALDRADIMHLTEVDEAVEGDTLFPPYDKSDWLPVSELRHAKDDRHAYAFRFCTYHRV